MNFPADLRYTAHDEWCRLEGDVLVLGISDFAQDALGELVHIEFPDVGKVFAAGDEAAEVESVKAVAPVYSPVAGTVVAVNSALDGNEGDINSKPYASWLFKIKVADVSSVAAATLDAAAYQAKIAR